MTREAYTAEITALWERSGRTGDSVADACRAAAAPKDSDVFLVSRSTVYNWLGGETLPNPSNKTAYLFCLGYLSADRDQQEFLLESALRLRTQQIRLSRRRSKQGAMGPYRGLASYEISDAPAFFGRDKLVDTVLTKIDALHEAGGGVTLVTGVSGAGKSSLLKAGVIPKLKDQQADERRGRQALYVEAGADPLQSLARAVAHCLDVEAAVITTKLRSGPTGIEDVVWSLTVNSAAPGVATTSTSLVLVVDQLEQALNAKANATAVEEFLGVVRVLAGVSVPTAVLLGVRLDFLTPAMRRLRNLAVGQPVIVGLMSDDELREVIEKPADNHNIALAAGFATMLLREIASGGRGHEAGILPWLSHALSMTYQHCMGRGGKEMTAADYQAVDGLDGAIAATASKVFGPLSDARRKTTKRLFLGLIDSNLSGADTRRKVPLDEIEQEIPGCRPEDLIHVIDLFVDARLLTIDGDTLEITHDVVMVAWPTLAEWLAENRKARIALQELNTAARDWDRGSRSPDTLPRGQKLKDAHALCRANPAIAARLTGEFVRAAQQVATRAKRVRRAVKSAGAALAAGVLILAGVAIVQGQHAQQQRDEAQSRTLASESIIMRDKDITLAREFALAGYRISHTREARSALIDATALPPAVRMLDGTAGIMNAVALAPSGTVAALAADKVLQLRDISDRAHPRPLPNPAGGCGAKIYAVAYSPHGDLLAAACGNGTIHLWDARDPLHPVPLPTLTGLGAKVYSLSFSPDGSMMAAAIAEKSVAVTPMTSVMPGSIQLWRLSGMTLQPLGGAVRVNDIHPAKSVSFRPDNSTLAVGADDGTVQLWDITTPDLPTNPLPATGMHKGVGQLAFSPDGAILAAGGADFTVHLWDTHDPRNPTQAGAPITGADSWVNALAFSPDGATLAIASSDQHNGLRLVDLASRQVIATIPHPAPVTSVRYSADGSTVITGANDGTARLWPVASPTLAGMDYLVSATRFSPDGTRLAVGSGDLRVYDVTHPTAPRLVGTPQTNADHFSGALVYSPDGGILAESHGASGTIQLWDTASAGPPTPVGPPLKADSGEVDALAFSPDSMTLATGGRDGAVHLWDLHIPQAPARLSTPGTLGGFVNDLTFSPDGRLLVAGGNDKTVRIWNVHDPRAPAPVGKPITPGDHYVFATKISPDGKTLAIGLADDTVRLYDLTDPARAHQIGAPLVGCDNYVYALSFNSDGNTLAVASVDGTVWLWDIHDRTAPTPQATLTLPGDAVYAINFRPHSSVLAAGGMAKQVYVWITDPDAAAALVCSTTGDSITPAEWTKYMPDRQYTPPCP